MDTTSPCEECRLLASSKVMYPAEVLMGWPSSLWVISIWRRRLRIIRPNLASLKRGKMLTPKRRSQAQLRMQRLRCIYSLVVTGHGLVLGHEHSRSQDSFWCRHCAGASINL